jgi:hypothetical protein
MRGVILVEACLLCECAGTILADPAKHTLTRAEPLHVAANGDNFARKFIAEHKWKRRPLDGTKLSLPELKIDRVQAGGAHDNKDLAWPRGR